MTVNYDAIHYSTRCYLAVNYGAIHYSTQYNAIRHVQCNAIWSLVALQYTTVHNAAQYKCYLAVNYGAIHYSTQYNAI